MEKRPDSPIRAQWGPREHLILGEDLPLRVYAEVSVWFGKIELFHKEENGRMLVGEPTPGDLAVHQRSPGPRFRHGFGSRKRRLKAARVSYDVTELGQDLGRNRQGGSVFEAMRSKGQKSGGGCLSFRSEEAHSLPEVR